MSYSVFMHRSDSIFDESPAEQYQFPKQYLGRAEGCIGDWIVYLEPLKVTDTRGYFAIARVQQIISDAKAPDMYLALMEQGSYLDFSRPVPFNDENGPLDVEPQQVIPGQTESADGRLGADTAMRSVPIVAVHPEWQFGGAIAFGAQQYQGRHLIERLLGSCIPGLNGDPDNLESIG
jgi:hypothetical protein